MSQAVRAEVFFFANEALVGGLEVVDHGGPLDLGTVLADTLKGSHLINGIDIGVDALCQVPTMFNGIRCLGAWLIGQLKRDHLGKMYLTASFPEIEDDWLPWTYVLRQVSHRQDILLGTPPELMFEVYQNGRMVYGGPVAKADMTALEPEKAAGV